MSEGRSFAAPSSCKLVSSNATTASRKGGCPARGRGREKRLTYDGDMRRQQGCQQVLLISVQINRGEKRSSLFLRALCAHQRTDRGQQRPVCFMQFRPSIDSAFRTSSILHASQRQEEAGSNATLRAARLHTPTTHHQTTFFSRQTISAEIRDMSTYAAPRTEGSTSRRQNFISHLDGCCSSGNVKR